MSVSLCVLRVEVDEDLPEMGDNPLEIGKYNKVNTPCSTVNINDIPLWNKVISFYHYSGLVIIIIKM